jgi:transposase
MSTVVCRNINGKEYILGITAYRRENDNKPTSNSITLGSIDEKSRKPVYNDKYEPWIKEHGLDLDTALKDYIKRTSKKITIDFTNHLMQLEKRHNDYPLPIVSDNFKDKFSPSTSDDDLLYSNNHIRTSKKCSFGAIYLLDYLSQSLGLDDILSEVFLDQAKKIKALVYFNILDRRSLMYCSNFIQNYNISIPSAELSSQRITEVLKNITDQDMSLFYNLWANKISENEYLALDSTSISSYSSLITKTAYGYNKQHEKLKQVNLCLIFGEESGLPVYIQPYNGSLHDVSTLLCTTIKCALIQNKSYKFVLDRGFYSKKNINHLLFSDYKSDFIVGLPGTTQLNKDLIKEYKFILEDINYAIQFNGSTLFAASKKVKWEKKYINAITYVDPTKNDQNRDSIIAQINMMYQNACENPEDYIDDPDYRYVLSFRRSNKRDNGYIVKKNNEAYKEFRSREGWFILLSNCDSDPLQTLEIYRKRDVVEKAFNVVKNFQQQNRTRVHSDDVYDSKVFIGFLSMILISQIHKILKDNNIYKDKTMDEFLDILSTIKAVIINNKYIIDPLTKATKDYYKLFHCPLPNEYYL